MNRNREIVRNATFKPEETAYDATVVSKANGLVTVRFHNNSRKVSNPLRIADHIAYDKIQVGDRVKVSSKYDRGKGRRGQFFISDIMPRAGGGKYGLEQNWTWV